jgi:molybdenum cofactor cytidylyltransferase
MFSSVQCAARWNGWNTALTHWAIVLGDQPQLRRETLRALLDFVAARPGEICQPSWSGRPRHPVVLPGSIFRRLRDCAQDNLKDFLNNAAAPASLCASDDPGLDMDLDTPLDYEKALRLLGPESP